MPNIVVVSVTPWEGSYLKSTVELSKELSARNTVWFVDYQYTWKDLMSGITGRNKNIPWKRMLGLQSRIKKISLQGKGHVLIYTPKPIFPSFWTGSFRLFSFINRINQYLVLKPLKKKLKKTGVVPDVMISALNPFMGLGIKRFFPDIQHVYYCFDEIRAAHWLRIFGGTAEKQLLPTVDGAVFTSDHLEKTKGAPVAKTTVVKNGVHYDAFARHKRKAGQNEIPKAGYVGSIDDRFHIDLMEQVIQRMPEVNFHLVGRVVDQTVPERLNKYSNVFFSPPVSADKVPSIMGSMDVGIIPYVRNDFTVAVYPLKVNEYLSVGLPVIMTSFADLPDFKDVADIADDPSAFTEAIKRNLENDKEENICRRMQFASANSWSNRAADLEKFLFTE